MGTRSGMPKLGRPPVAEAIKRLRGSAAREPGERRVNVPSPPTKLPAPPDVLEGEALAEYERLGRLLVEAGMSISELDRHALVRHCHAWAVWTDAVTRIKATSPVIRQPSGRLARNPYCDIAVLASAELNCTATMLGLSPSARLRMGTRANELGDDPWAQFLEPFAVVEGGKS